jgi:hypothetical protein
LNDNFGIRIDICGKIKPIKIIIMKTKAILSTIVILLFAIDGKAQDKQEDMQTLFGKGITTIGGYGGPRVAYSNFNGKETWLVGGRGGVILNRSFVIGGAGYGIVNSPIFNISEEVPVAYLEGGYGGLLLEYIVKPMKLVHLSFPLVIGGGNLMYSDTPMSMEGHDFNQRVLYNTNFFVIEPGAEIELNVVRFMRIAVGVSYRYAHNLNLPNTPRSAFNSFSGTFALKFGRF